VVDLTLTSKKKMPPFVEQMTPWRMLEHYCHDTFDETLGGVPSYGVLEGPAMEAFHEYKSSPAGAAVAPGGGFSVISFNSFCTLLTEVMFPQ
jgi:hypothetical protein